MFCDTCHWYTAGKNICPHCGAKQKPKAAKDMFNLPSDVSVLDDSFMDRPLVDAPMPTIGTSAPPAAPQALTFCGKCGTRASAGKFCAACGAQLPRSK